MVTLEDVKDCISSGGVPHTLRSSPENWPVQMSAHGNSKNCEEALRGRKILIVGTTLGDQSACLPYVCFESWVVLTLRNYKGALRYGDATVSYIKGNPSTWEGQVDETRSEAVWSIVNSLVEQWHCAPFVSMLGISAGVAKIWAVVANAGDTELVLLKHVVSICGAWHPILVPRLLKQAVRANTFFFVHHHENDKLCPWSRELSTCWESLEKQIPNRIYINLLRRKQFWDNCYGDYHDISEMLLRMRNFWTLMEREPSNTSDVLTAFCSEHRLGRGDIVPSSENFASNEIALFPFDFAQSCALAAVIVPAIEEASMYTTQLCARRVDAHKCPWWLQDFFALPLPQAWQQLICRCIRALWSSRNKPLRDAILTGFAKEDGVEDTLRYRLLAKALDAMLTVCSCRSFALYSLCGVEGKEVCIEELGQRAGMCLLLLTFPEEPWQYLSLEWGTLSSPTLREHEPNYFNPWPPRWLKQEDFQQQTFSHHTPAPSAERLKQGVSQNDVLVLVLRHGTESFELSTVVQSEQHYQKKRKGQPIVHERSEVRAIVCATTNTQWSALLSWKDAEACASTVCALKRITFLPVGKYLTGVDLWTESMRHSSGLGKLLVGLPYASTPSTQGPFYSWANSKAGVSSCGSSDTGQVESGLDVTLQKKFQSTIGIWKQSPAQQAFLINGPPGTGKTTACALLIKTLSSHAENSKSRFWSLHVGHSNSCINAQVQGALDNGINPESIRIMAGTKNCNTSLKQISLRAVDLNAWSMLLADERELHFFSTTARLCQNKQKFIMPMDMLKLAFDCILVDEAGQNLAENTMPLLHYARKDVRFILVGDIAQLPPTCSRRWQVLTPMRAANVSLVPQVLEEQHRTMSCLADVNSYVFYNGIVHNAPGVPTEHSMAQTSFLYITYPDPRQDARTPVTEEAAFVVEMYRAMKSRFGNKTIGVLSPYALQLRALRGCGLSADVVRSVDGYQGEERDIIILSVGISGGTMGFLKDPRRTCVALTRAKFLLLIIANDALGADQCWTRGSSSWWSKYRALLAGLGKTHQLQRLDVQGCYEIINALTQAPRKSRDDVSACMNIGGLGDFFKNYQRKWIGVLDGLCEVLQSDAEDESDAEAGVSSCGSSDTGHSEEEVAAAVSVAVGQAQDCRVTGPGQGPCMSGEAEPASFSAYFAQCTITGLGELFRIATADIEEAEGHEIMHRRRFELWVIRGLAKYAYHCYRCAFVDDRLHPSIDFFAPIKFPNNVETTLASLCSSYQAVYEFFLALMGLAEDHDSAFHDGVIGSSYLWMDYCSSRRRAWEDLRQRRFVLVFPYILLQPLLVPRVLTRATQSLAEKRPRTHGEQARRFIVPLGIVDPRFTDKTIAMTPFNPLAAVRRGGQTNATNDTVGHFFVSLSNLAADASAMPTWWLPMSGLQ